MESQNVLNIIAIATRFNCLPSEVISIDNEDVYAKYCFNEACMYLLKRIEDKETPHFKVSKKIERENPLLQKMLAGAY